MKMMRSFFTALLFGGLGLSAFAQNLATLDYQLAPRSVAADTWVIEGKVEDFAPSNGCNIINTGFIKTAAGIIVINTGPSKRYGEQQRAAIEKSSGAKLDSKAGSNAQPITVLNLNLHPDYFFGNQAWVDAKPQALAGTRQGQQAEGESYATNLYKICGDWMLGSQSTPAVVEPKLGRSNIGGHDVELLRLSGHTDDDLVLLDHSTGTAFVGGLVFTQRIPTTPHAKIKDWLKSLDSLEAKLQALPLKVLVPSHGPVRGDLQGLSDTRDYLTWLDKYLQSKAQSGAELIEVYQARKAEVPKRFQDFAVFDAEYLRNLTNLYPSYEAQALAK